MKLELLSGKTGAEVTAIWKDYHGAKEGTHGITVPNKAEVAQLRARGKEFPMMVFPCFRDQGYFVLLSQWHAPGHWMLTSLEDFKGLGHGPLPL